MPMSTRKVISAQVGDDGKVELATDLPAGTLIEVQFEPLASKEQAQKSMLQFIDWLSRQPPSYKTDAEWKAFEEELQRERDAWD